MFGISLQWWQPSTQVHSESYLQWVMWGNRSKKDIGRQLWWGVPTESKWWLNLFHFKSVLYSTFNISLFLLDLTSLVCMSFEFKENNSFYNLKGFLKKSQYWHCTWYILYSPSLIYHFRADLIHWALDIVWGRQKAEGKREMSNYAKTLTDCQISCCLYTLTIIDDGLYISKRPGTQNPQNIT